MLPGFVLMFLLSWIYLTFDLKATAFQAVFLGIQPAVIALIVRACHRIGGHCLTDGPLWVIGILAAIAELLGVSFYISLPLAGISYVVAMQRRWPCAVSAGTGRPGRGHCPSAGRGTREITGARRPHSRQRYASAVRNP